MPPKLPNESLNHFPLTPKISDPQDIYCKIRTCKQHAHASNGEGSCPASPGRARLNGSMHCSEAKWVGANPKTFTQDCPTALGP